LHHHLGAYLTAEGEILIEPCSIIRAYTSTVERHMAELQTLASNAAAVLAQRAVMLAVLKVTGSLSWVQPNNLASAAELDHHAGPRSDCRQALPSSA
jgi:hypothetical protein